MVGSGGLNTAGQKILLKNSIRTLSGVTLSQKSVKSGLRTRFEWKNHAKWWFASKKCIKTIQWHVLEVVCVKKVSKPLSKPLQTCFVAKKWSKRRSNRSKSLKTTAGTLCEALCIKKVFQKCNHSVSSDVFVIFRDQISIFSYNRVKFRFRSWFLWHFSFFLLIFVLKP